MRDSPSESGTRARPAPAPAPDSAVHSTREPSAAARPQPNAQTALLEQRDRVQGMLAEARGALTRGQPSAALAVLEALKGGVPAPMQTEVDALRSAADRAIDESIVEIEGLIRRAAAPLAAREAAKLTIEPNPRVDRALRDLARRHAWPRLHDPVLPHAFPEGARVPLAPDRNVHVLFRGRWCSGVVVGPGDRSATSSVRIQSDDGVYFPVVPRAEVAPQAPSPAELGDQIAAALAAGDARLASAWMAVSLAHGVPLAPELRRELAQWFVPE